ncbi:hypothetical protein [Paenibacillus sp. 276b]|uniref:hypothetical protein n=1 Tax=Paenibacillus sp. 276b TaxID=1566277 RepID=UPI000896BB51|nr:hypothetical protein [Paenibacillus sp. 276b]SEB27497.1 hypothetical protein SAMN03159332_6158 [Paenibacillus sp. 276b]
MPRNPSFIRRVTFSADSMMNKNERNSDFPLSNFWSQLIRELLSYVEFQLLCESTIDQILDDYELNRILKNVEEEKIQKQFFELYLFKELEKFSLFNNDRTKRLSRFYKNYDKKNFDFLDCIDRINFSEKYTMEAEKLHYKELSYPLTSSLSEFELNNLNKRLLYYKNNTKNDCSKKRISEDIKSLAINNHLLDSDSEECVFMNVSQARVLLKELIDSL